MQLTSEAGLALLTCQTFEASLRLLLGYLEQTGAIQAGNGSGDNLMETLDKWTAGRLAGLLREHAGLLDPDGVISRAVTARNHIVHRFFLTCLPVPPIDAAGYSSASDQLGEWSTSVEQGQQLITPHLHRFGVEVDGIDYAMVEQAMLRALAVERHAEQALPADGGYAEQ
jgi:hypothetical protein